MPEQTGIQIAIIRLSGSVNGEIQGNVPSTDMGGVRFSLKCLIFARKTESHPS